MLDVSTHACSPSVFGEAFRSQLYLLETAKDFVNYSREINGEISLFCLNFIASLSDFPPELMLVQGGYNFAF